LLTTASRIPPARPAGTPADGRVSSPLASMSPASPNPADPSAARRRY